MGLRSCGVRRRRRHVAAIALGLCLVGLVDGAGAAERTRGVRLLGPAEEMTPAPAPERRPAAALGTVRIASADGQAARLSGLSPRGAPFEVVAPSANPDLVWDPGTRNVAAGRDVVAYNVDLADLPAVIDRTAAVRGLTQLAAERPQAMRLSDSSRPLRGGQQIELDVPDVGRRSLLVAVISGDGTVQLLYPIGSDPRSLDVPTYKLDMQVREPYGTDIFLAVSSAQPADMLEQGIRQLSHYRSAIELVDLLKNAAPPDARVGLLSLVSRP
jgi:hypothetical protein